MLNMGPVVDQNIATEACGKWLCMGELCVELAVCRISIVIVGCVNTLHSVTSALPGIK